jgi:transposase
MAPMSRHNLTDLEWKTIRCFLPRERTGKPERPWQSHRQVFNGIVFVLQTGIPWLDLHRSLGSSRPFTIAFVAG